MIGMKRLSTWLNEYEYKLFLKEAKKRGLTPYQLAKQQVLECIESPREYTIKMSIIYAYILYSLACAAFVLLF